MTERAVTVVTGSGLNRLKVIIAIAGLAAIAALSILLALSRADLNLAESDKRVLASDNALQAKVIATQAFNVNRFNDVAQLAAQANALANGDADNTVTEYREILRHEKTCDLPVPAHIADGLLRHANRLRASAMHTDPGVPDATNDSAAAASGMTYCQAVLWIAPLLTEIEKGNNNLSGIRQIEKQRSGTP